MSDYTEYKIKNIYSYGGVLARNMDIYLKYNGFGITDYDIIKIRKGKSFQTLFRNIETSKPARYLEGKDDSEKGFVMLDCLFDLNGSIARIRRYTNKKEVSIDYTENRKNITVKTKNS